MAKKWTSGPWHRDCWDILGNTSNGGTGHVCEITMPNGDDDRFWKDGEADANARLIAAAPELYEALARWKERLSAPGPCDVDLPTLLHMTDAALAKARGETS